MGPTNENEIDEANVHTSEDKGSEDEEEDEYDIKFPQEYHSPIKNS